MREERKWWYIRVSGETEGLSDGGKMKVIKGERKGSRGAGEGKRKYW